MEDYTRLTEPRPNRDAVVEGANFRFTLIRDTVLRFEWSEDGIFEDRSSAFALNRFFPRPYYTVKRSAERIVVRTDSIQITYNHQRFDRHGLVVSFINKERGLCDTEWRYGENPPSLGGTARTLDVVSGRCELEPGILSRFGYSVIDDSHTMLFDGDGLVAPRRPGDRIDGYLFYYGHDYQRAMATFYAISGSQPRLPRWALGNWSSRPCALGSSDGDHPASADKSTREPIPLAVAIIDLKWNFVVDGARVTQAGSWDGEPSPELAALTQTLRDRNLKVALNDRPNSGTTRRSEDSPEAFAPALALTPAPARLDATDGESVCDYFDIMHRKLEKDGCDFWWLDWQLDTPPRASRLNALWMLNHYQFMDRRVQQGDERAVTLSRYAGPGSHRYPVGYLGVVPMTWKSLRFQPQFIATASNIGFGWWSREIGVNHGVARNDELAARWVQLGAFSPILRLHSVDTRWLAEEAWRHHESAAASMMTFLRLRHRLVPYIYTMMIARPHSGEPLIQPMYWKFPTRDEAYAKSNQYYFGSNLIVAPIVTPHIRKTNCAAVDVWLPPGRFVDLFTGIVYDGDRQIKMHRNILTIPVLAPEGAIIPLDLSLSPENGCRNPPGLEVFVVVGKDGELVIREDFEDDGKTGDDGDIEMGEGEGEGEEDLACFRDIAISYKQAHGVLMFDSAGKEWSITFLSLNTLIHDVSVVVDGHYTPEFTVSWHTRAGVGGLTIHIPRLASDKSVVAIKIGPDPQLSVQDIKGQAHDIIVDLDLGQGLRELIWRALLAPPANKAVKMSRLRIIAAERGIHREMGPLLELLMADGRRR